MSEGKWTIDEAASALLGIMASDEPWLASIAIGHLVAAGCTYYTAESAWVATCSCRTYSCKTAWTVRDAEKVCRIEWGCKCR